MIRSVLENYMRDVHANVWHRPEYEGIAYSDGDEIEGRLKNIIEGASDVSVMSIELAGRCSDWPTRYHLSHQRANLLRPFEEQLKGKQVLEIGAGCGAITRYLGEVGAEVLALEGSFRRASITALRCRDLENVSVVAEAVHNFKSIPQFDVVTLIGVLEYARKFFPGEGRDPVDAMLKYVTGFLKPAGRLIIAIENQIGLKYFAGFSEDHIGKPMFGIEEHYGCNSAVTFGRKDLGVRTSRAGLSVQEWWYPFPDYKLPSLMLSELGTFPQDDMDLSPLVRNACSHDPQYPLSVNFIQERAWRPIMRNGLLRELTNSFVLVASDSEISDVQNTPLAIHYATNRRLEFSKKVVFFRTKNGVPMTHQVSLYPQAIPRQVSLLTQQLENQIFVKGQNWQDRLVDIMTSPDWTIEQLQQWFQVWFNAFNQAVSPLAQSFMTGKNIPGKFIDLIPRNMCVDDRGVTSFFDQEWIFSENLDVDYLVFRALFSSLGGLGNIAQPRDSANIHIMSLVRQISQAFGFEFTAQSISQHLAFEREFQIMATGKPQPSADGVASWKLNVRHTQSHPSTKEIEYRKQINELHLYIKQRDGHVQKVQDTLEERNSLIRSIQQTLKERDEQIITLQHALARRPMSDTPMVSVIVSTMSSSAWLCVALQSIVVQTLTNFEIVVINDAGIDVDEVLKSFDSHQDIQYVRHAKPRGLAAARKTGLGVARGKYIAYLDEGFQFCPDHLSMHIRTLEKTGQKFSYSDVQGNVEKTDGESACLEGDGGHQFLDQSSASKNSKPISLSCVVHERAWVPSTVASDQTFEGWDERDVQKYLCQKSENLHVPHITVEWRQASPHANEEFAATTKASCNFKIMDDSVLSSAQGERAVALEDSSQHIGSFHASSIKNLDSHSSGKLVHHVVVVLNDPICGVIRLLNPIYECFARNWLKGEAKAEVVKPDFLEGPHTSWVVQRTCRYDIELLKRARSNGTRLVHDLDDLLWKIPDGNKNKNLISPVLIERLFKLLELADCVTVSTKPLRVALEMKGIKAHVLPNCLIAHEWEQYRSQRKVGRRPRVGWAGQVGVHTGDLALLHEVMERLGEEVEWAFLGEQPLLPQKHYLHWESHSAVTLDKYPQALASLNLDVALAPLAVNEFNEAKSDLRILQYGILGYPVVATDIYPHQSAPVTRVPNDPKAWVQAIREHIYDCDASEKEGEGLRQWVLENRMMDKWLPQYQAAWVGEIPAEFERIPTFHTTSLAQYGKQDEARPDREKFDCSIIIPVCNKVELTSQCLTHLAQVTHGCSYEVIVVDNASTDGTGLFLSSLEGDIQIVTNDSNLGFGKACNQGAKASSGKYLVFLNNDTIPQEEWLSALVDEVEQHPDVAIVGSKLLYPNNTIQHAGVAFSKKGRIPYHIFNGVPSDLKAVNIRQEFQAVTAACLLIRKEDFESISGFDEQFINGFEDVDLCLKIRESGKKVIYQPKSMLYHLEEQTPGRKNPETERQNGRLLMDRWAEKIVVDEDYYTVSAGYASRYSSEKGTLGLSLETFNNEAEKSQWEQIKTVQELLLKRRYDSGQSLHEQIDATIRTTLLDSSNWPNDVDVLKWAATVCGWLECVESECAFLKRVLSLEEDREAREKLANQALKHGDLSEASQHVEALLALNPNDGSGFWFQGILAMQFLEYTKAAESFQQALTVGYDAQKTGLGMGMAWMGVGDASKAWDAFQDVIASNPDNQEAVKCLIQAGTALQRWEALASHLTRFLERNPADCDMRFALAGVELRAGHSQKAKEQLAVLRLIQPDYEGLEDLETVLQPSNDPTPALA
ncbi:MAG: glycosyltransferase, partial [Nitrospirota bacterium]|nr:glycosyltransferase [Nitrospirota bacterium]